MIKLTSVTKKFKQKLALDDISFNVSQNTCVGLIGNNGAGKSTLINVLANLTPIDSGKVEIINKQLTSNYLSYKDKIGFILSRPYYIEDLTTKEYLNFIGKFRKIKKSIIEKRKNDLFDILNFNEQDKAIKDLSKGNQVKVSIVASLIHNPSILIYDEPFANLDLETQNTLKKVLLKIKGTKTLLITSHNLELILDICDHFLVLDNGKLIINKSRNAETTNSQIKNEIVKQINRTKNTNLPKWLE